MRNKFIYFCVSILFIRFLSSCSVGTSITQYDYSYLYDDNQSIINPKYKVFHHSLDSSTLYYEIKSNDILYERLNGDSSMIAQLKLKYDLYLDRDLKVLVDSAQRQMFNFGSNGKNTTLQNHFSFKAEIGNYYWLVIRFRDENKDLNVINTVEIDKRNNLNSQYFTYRSEQKVLINSISNLTEIEIEKSPLIVENEFTMEKSSMEFPMTPPPFVQVRTSTQQINVDSSYHFTFNNNKFLLKNAKAFNQFKIEQDTSERWNYVFYFSHAYPEISKIKEMLEPTRYISTSKEYKTVKAAINPKKALDEFWLKLGKNEDRTKGMIREYYSRIEIANRYFSSYKEGWKTDRGLIYIIYGNPTTIRKNANSESWVYGEADNILSVQFSFYKNATNLSENDFELNRDIEYKNNWYRAVDQWRQGKIY